jgi:hypothetical protein
MKDHRSAMFGSLESAVASPGRDDRGDESENSPKSSGPIESQCDQRTDCGDHSRRPRLLAPFGVREDQRLRIRHPSKDVVDLVTSGIYRKVRPARSQNQDDRGKLGKSTPAREYGQNRKKSSEENENDREMNYCRVEWVWNLKHKVPVRLQSLSGFSGIVQRKMSPCVPPKFLFSSPEIAVFSVSLK